MDRFFMCLKLGYMTRGQEISVLRRPDTKQLLEDVRPIVSGEEISALRAGFAEVRVSDDVAAGLPLVLDLLSDRRVLNL